MLAVGCWDQTLSFFDPSAKQIKFEKLDFDPCVITPYQNGEYWIVGGSNKELFLYSKEGIRLCSLGKGEDWMFACAPRPQSSQVAYPAGKGRVVLTEPSFGTVHALYQDMYVCREAMTNVLVQSLSTTQQSLSLACEDYVQKVALTKNRLAIQVPHKIIVAELRQDAETGEFFSRQLSQIPFEQQSSLILVTAQDVAVALSTTILLLGLDGTQKMQWNMESQIMYMKVIGGPPGKESLLVGLKNGEIHIVYVNNAFSTRLLTHTSSIRVVDLSLSRNNLALVDENSDLFVYSTSTKEIVLHERQVSGVAFNTEFEQMLCYSSHGMLSVRVADLPVFHQPAQGTVVGLKGSKVFCMHHRSMLAYDVPQTDALHKFIARKNYQAAYRIACLGVTHRDWKSLATAALRDLSTEIAKKAFLRCGDTKHMDLIAELEEDRSKGNVSEQAMQAKVLAFLGDYDAAAKLYAESGDAEKAVELFASLRDYEKALQYIGLLPNKSLRKALVMSQAKWCEEIGRWLEAALVYATAGLSLRAVTILGERGLIEDLLALTRQQKLDAKALRKAGDYFVRFKAHPYAREAFLQLGDMGALIQLHVRLGEWESAIAIAEQHPQLLSRVFLPYAAYLAEHGCFDDAQKAYHRAGRHDQAIQLLREMQNDAVAKSQFRVASRYLWMISNEFLATKDPADVLKSEYALMLAEMYLSYDLIYQSTYSSVTTHASDVLFNAGLFLIATLSSHRFNSLNSSTSLSVAQTPPSTTSVTPAVPSSLPLRDDSHALEAASPSKNTSLYSPLASSSLSSRTPEGISYALTLYSLHRHAWRLGAWRFLRSVCRKLAGCKLPQQLTHQVELTSLLVRSKPVQDSAHLTQFCWRCNSVNTLGLDGKDGDACQFCGHRFIRSFSSFLPLPIVEFYADDGIPQSEVETLLRALPPSQASLSFGNASSPSSARGLNSTRRMRDEDGWAEEIHGGDDDGGYQRLSITGSGLGRTSSAARGSRSATPSDSDTRSGRRGGESGTSMGLFRGTQFGSLMYQVQHGNSTLKVSLSREGLREMPPESVFITKHPPPLRWRYYVSMVESVPIVLCSVCFHFFTEEDFALSIYATGKCPFCATPLNALSADIQKRYVVKSSSSNDSYANNNNINNTQSASTDTSVKETQNSSRSPSTSKKPSSSSSSSSTSEQPAFSSTNKKNQRQVTVSSSVWRMPTIGNTN